MNFKILKLYIIERTYEHSEGEHEFEIEPVEVGVTRGQENLSFVWITRGS